MPDLELGGMMVAQEKEEYWVEIVNNLGVQLDHISFLQEIITPKMTALCASILLTGSWAAGDGRESSDLDLLIITTNQQNRTKIVGTLKSSLGTEKGRLNVDVKVLTTSDILESKNNEYHFMIWLCLRNSICLYGVDYTSQYKLNHERVVQIAASQISQFEESYNLLENQTKLSAIIIVIVNTLKTFYFIDRYILSNGIHPENKEIFLKSMLGDSYRDVMKKYYHIIGTGVRDFKLSTNVRILDRTDRNYKPKLYHDMFKIWKNFETYIQSIYLNLVIKYT
ncbi:MAG: nucleotidyltransferase domain-containing protein [Candidatus Thorarchaeota archaeon]